MSQLEYDLAAQQEFSDDSEASLATAALGPILINEFKQAELERRETELRWLEDLRQYRGQYNPCRQ